MSVKHRKRGEGVEGGRRGRRGGGKDEEKRGI